MNETKNNNRERLVCLTLIVVTLAIFSPLSGFEFLNFDDDLYVTQNPHVKAGLTGKGILWALRTMHANFWHPLTWLSHMLDCQFFGLNPAMHHLTNLLFHIANSVLLFICLRRMTRTLGHSAFVAALFALHPLHVESVAWVAERKDLLSTFFWMLTIWAYFGYVQHPDLNRYLLTLFAFALGLMAKPMLVTLPFVLLLLDFWPLDRIRFNEKKNMRIRKLPIFHLIREKLPLFALSTFASIVAYLAQQKGGALPSLDSVPPMLRIANALISYVIYIKKMFWPTKLAIFYPYPETLPIWQIAGAGLFLAFLSGLALIALKRRPYFAVGWFWFIGTLVPVIGLVQVGSFSMADRYTYIPLIGLFIIIAWGIPDLVGGIRYRRVILSTASGIILLGLMITTRIQVQHWKNSITLFQYTLNITTNNFLAHNNLGAALYEQGKITEAVRHYSEALKIKPSYVEAHNNLGVALYELGQITEAINHYSKALRIKPDFAAAHNNLGLALSKQGKTQEAMIHYSEALRIKPDYAIAHNNLGASLAEQGKFEEAISHFSEALRTKPDYAEARRNLMLARSLFNGQRPSNKKEQ